MCDAMASFLDGNPRLTMQPPYVNTIAPNYLGKNRATILKVFTLDRSQRYHSAIWPLSCAWKNDLELLVCALKMAFRLLLLLVNRQVASLS